jgi:hypothetical protein
MRIGSLTDQLETCRQLLRVPAYRSSGTRSSAGNGGLAAFNSVSTAQTVMPGSKSAGLAADFPDAAACALRDAASECGLHARDARVVR